MSIREHFFQQYAYNKGDDSLHSMCGLYQQTTGGVGMFFEVEKVGFVYQTPSTEIEVLKDVSFEIEEGGFVD